MGFFTGLDTEAYDRTYSDTELMKRIAGYFRPYKKRVQKAMVFVVLVSVSGAGVPLLVAQSVKSLAGKPSWTTIGLLSFGMIIFGVGIWVANWMRRRLVARIIGDVVSSLRHDAFDASIKHDMTFFDQYESGRIISRITSDTQEFAQVVQLVTDIFSQIVLVLILSVVLVNISWQLTLAILALIPVVVFLTSNFRKLARYVTQRGFRVLAKVNASIQEAVTGISIAKNFRQEEAIYYDFSDVNHQSYHVNVRRGFVLASVFPVLNIMSSLATAAILYWGGISTQLGMVTVAAWYLFLASVDRFWFPIINLSVFWSQFQAGLSASERVFALIDAQSVVKQSDNRLVDNGGLCGEIVYDKVNFWYTKQERVLNNFSLHIAPGESVALVGHTGAGKSSLIKLITRFYEFQGGNIQIDGQDIRSFDLPDYRRQLGLVSQTPFLFSGTVADNIRYARPNLTDGDVEAVARQIGGGEWLDTLPNGLQSDVGERGARLSMGQRQLVALTRVLAQEPAIFILDEATASIDPFTEAQIQEALDLILGRSTAILIAHRLSTVRSADRIIVLKNGSIIEEGNHEQLMMQNGHYADLYNTYFRHQSLAYIEAAGKGRK